MDHAVARFLLRYLLIPLVALWGYHLFLRRRQSAIERRRRASLYLALVNIGLWMASYLFLRFSIPDIYLIPLGFLAAVIVYWRKEEFLPWRARCVKCGSSLPMQRILFDDSEECEACESRQKADKEIDS